MIDIKDLPSAKHQDVSAVHMKDSVKDVLCGRIADIIEDIKPYDSGALFRNSYLYELLIDDLVDDLTRRMEGALLKYIKNGRINEVANLYIKAFNRELMRSMETKHCELDINFNDEMLFKISFSVNSEDFGYVCYGNPADWVWVNS